MNEFEQFIVTTIIFLSIAAMVFFFSRKRWLPWYRRHSQLGQMAIQSMGAWAGIIVIAGLIIFVFGKEKIPSLIHFCALTGTIPIVLLQFRFRNGWLNDSSSGERPVFDERDYRIGQEALQNAYLVFWILVWFFALSMFTICNVQRLELPYWSMMLVLPVVAMTVSIVHAISILVLYRRDNRETETASDG